MITIKPIQGRLVGKAAEQALQGVDLGKTVDVVLYAVALAETIRERHVQNAQTADAVRQYSAKGKRRLSRAYQQAVGLPGNQVMWKSSLAFHQAARIRLGSFAGTGGMWAGLDVRNLGKRGAFIELRGRSLGQIPRCRKGIKEMAALRRQELERIAKLKSAKARQNARDRLKRIWAQNVFDRNEVTNNLKAWSVLMAMGAHPLKMRAAERQVLVWKFSVDMQREVDDLLLQHMNAVDLLPIVSRTGVLLEPGGAPELAARLRRRG